jgi:hypothetical protein
VCGPRGQIELLLNEYWERLSSVGRFEVGRPRLLDLAEIDRNFRAPGSPAVAVVSHAPGVGIPFTRQLQVEFVAGSPHFPGLPELICEPSYLFSGTRGGAGGPNATPQVHLDRERMTHLMGTLPQAKAPISHPCVALLDTGVDPEQNFGHQRVDMVDFIGADIHGVREGPWTDPNGHGTAMAQIIQFVNPNACIHPIRVLNGANQGECFEILIGLQYALYSGQFACVTACLAAPATFDCASSLGRSIEWMLGYTHRHAQVGVPMVIAAGGNDGTGSHSQYLAQMAGVIVARALDEHNQLAAYNSEPPPNAITESVYGGTAQQPIGTIGSDPLYGTSIAAAALTGAYMQ